MKSRSLVVAGAVLLALLSAAGIFLYLNNVRTEAAANDVTVLVPTADIPAGTEMNALIDQGAFQQLQVSDEAVVNGAVTSIGQLENRTAAVPILKGEQIPLGRLSGTEEALPGGVYGLTEGYQALTVKLDPEQYSGAGLRAGDHVTFYAHFDAGATVSSLKNLGLSVPKGVSAIGPEGITVMAVADARVLDVTQAPAGTDESASSSDNVATQQLVTLELVPEDAQRLVFSQNEGVVWFGLIRPDDKVGEAPPLDFGELVGK